MSARPKAGHSEWKSAIAEYLDHLRESLEMIAQAESLTEAKVIAEEMLDSIQRVTQHEKPACPTELLN